MNFLRKCFNFLPDIVCLFLYFVSTIAWWAVDSKWGDRFQHFTAYWAVLAAGLLVCVLVQKRFKLVLPVFFLLFMHASPVARHAFPILEPSPVNFAKTPQEITIVSANLLGGNPRHEDVVNRLKSLNADVLLLMEVSDAWKPALKALEEMFPYQVGEKRDTRLMSRWPMQELQEVKLTAAYMRSILPPNTTWPDTWDENYLLNTTLLVNGSPLRLVGIHPPIPSSSNRLTGQRLQIEAYNLALNAAPAANAKVLIGDFNTTPYSKMFERICNSTDLQDASQGFGYHPTWGPILPLCKTPFLPWLGLPIDHALISRDVGVLENEVGEIPGSDHRYRKLKLQF